MVTVACEDPVCGWRRLVGGHVVKGRGRAGRSMRGNMGGAGVAPAGWLDG